MTYARPDPLLIAAKRFTPTRLRRYRDNPVAFAHDVFKEKPTPYQDEILDAVLHHARIAVRAPHGAGKSFISSRFLWWFALTRDDARDDWKMPTTASAWRQLEEYLWPEIHKAWREIDWSVLEREPVNEGRRGLLDLKLDLRTGSAFAVASDQPSSIEGAHADELAYLFDEAKAIPDATFDAAEGAFSGAGPDTAANAVALAISTPGEPQGRFYDIHSRKPGYQSWWVRHVTLDEAVAAKRISAVWAEEKRLQWGEDSALFKNRVLGDFATADEDGVIPLAWVEAANDRWRRWNRAGRPGRLSASGLDVARSGRDRTVLALRYGHAVAPLERFPRAPTTKTVARAQGVLGAHGSGRPCIVDANGIGAGVYDRLRELGCDAYAFMAGAGTRMVDRTGNWAFADCRSAAWWMMRELLDPANGEDIALPPDDGLTGDLTAPKWVERPGTPLPKIKVEAKSDIAKRLGRSTDSADAVIQSFWEGEVEADGWELRDDRLRGRR